MIKPVPFGLFTWGSARRYLLVLLLVVAGGGGIFSEESTGHDPSLSVSFAGHTSLLVRIQQKDFVVFCPADYVFFKSEKKRTPRTESKISYSIMGKGTLGAASLAAFLHDNNPAISLRKAQKIARIYIEEARAEGVNYDIAFSQMCLETGFLQYGGSVLPGQNNFCGLGALSQKTQGLSFHDIRLGIRAHIQHLKAYASQEKLNRALVDPRFRFVKRGSITDINELSGRWAADRHYGKKIRYLLNRMYREKV
jgi:hypothetical protein